MTDTPTTDSSTAAPEWQSQARGGRLGNRFFITLIRVGGMWVTPFFLFWVALYFVIAAPAGRRASFDLAIRLGRGRTLAHRLWFAFRHFYTFGTLLLDRVAILGGGQADRYHIEFVGEELIRSALAQRRGVILLTGHIGNWEVMGQLLTRLDTPFNMVMFDGVPADLKATMENLARERSFKVLYTDGSPTAAAAMLKVLRMGEMIGMQGDRGLAGEQVEVPFLGGTAALPVGAYVLAAAAKAPLMHVFAVRRGWRRYSFHGFETAPMSYRNRRDKGPDLRRWASAFASRLEEFLREHPHQWGNFFPFWK